MTRPEEIRSCYSFSKQLVSSGHTQKSIHNSKNISHLEYSHAEQMLERSPRLWEKKISILFFVGSYSNQKVIRSANSKGNSHQRAQTVALLFLLLYRRQTSSNKFQLQLYLSRNQRVKKSSERLFMENCLL